MPVWWCIVKGSGYSDYPEAFKDGVNRGNSIQGAAWQKAAQHFHVAIAKTLPGTVADEKEAKKRFQMMFNKNRTLGLKLPNCPGFEYEKVYPGNSNFYQYFDNCGFEVLRPGPPSQAIVPAPQQTDAVDYYSVLGVDPGASIEDVKKRGRTLMKIYHPDKGFGDTEKFTAVYDALQALTGNVESCGERQIVVAPKITNRVVSDLNLKELDEKQAAYYPYLVNLKAE